MDWLLFIMSLVIAGVTMWGIHFFFNRRLREIGQIICWWYTTPAIAGIAIMCVYTIAGLFFYFTTYISLFLFSLWLGLVMLGFYFFFGRAAIGSFGVFAGGRAIQWNAIYDHRFTEKRGNRLCWQFRWKEQSVSTSSRHMTLIIPASYRLRVEEILRNTVHTQSNDITEETH